MRGQLVVDLPLRLDRDSPLGLTAQLVNGLRELIDEGLLHPRDALPSTRALATGLGLSRGTVVAAYDQLQAEGYLAAAAGSGTRVAASVRPRRSGTGRTTQREATAPAQPPIADLRPGTPDVSAIVSPPWRAAWRRAAAQPTSTIDPLGLSALRTEIAEHLRLMRSLVRPPEQVLVTSGAREGLALLLQCLARSRGRLTVGVERPGHPALSGVPSALGIATLALPTDEQGLITEALPSEGTVPDVVVVTPSHQYPNGGSLPLGRRQELIAWATRTGAVIAEDDYDSELRYVGMPLPALATLDDPDNGSVVLLGTFSTVLTPAVATGYLVAPGRLTGALGTHRRAAGLPTPALVQQALASYLASGELRRHIQRMRRDYRRRRAAIVGTCGRLPHARLAPLAGGLHAVLHTDRAGAQLVDELRAERILVGDLADYWGPHSSDVEGIVFGFAAVPPATLGTVLPIMARVCNATAVPGAPTPTMQPPDGRIS